MAVLPAGNREATPVVLVGATGAVATDELPLSAAATGAAGTVAATLTGTATTRVYLGGFVVDGLGATGASVIAVTVSGLLGGSQVYRISIPAGATLAIPRLQVDFSRPIAASAVNTPISVSAASFGAGNTVADVSAYGFHK